MEKEFLNDLVGNLLPQYDMYKDSIRELEDLDHLVESIQKTQGLHKELINMKLTTEAMKLDEVLESTYSKLREMLHQNTEASRPIAEDFEMWILQFEEEVRSVVPDAFPVPPAPSAASRLIPSSIQRTSRRLSNKVVRAMTKNTKYHDFLSMTRGQRHRYTNRITFIFLAWALAVIGMITSIAFLTRDFVLAQENLAIQVDRLPASPKTLPAITVCSDLQNVPPFEDFPNEEYPGLPMFSVTSYYSGNRSVDHPGIHLTYPKTLSNITSSPVESVVVSDETVDCRQKGFHVEREMKALKAIGQAGSFGGMSNSNGNCLHCFRIGVKIEEKLAPYHMNTSAALFSPAVQITVSKSRMYGICQSYFVRHSTFIEQLIASELFLHAKGLEQKKILDFNGHDYSVLKRRLSLDSVPKRADFYCNVYFFSGFYYPSLTDAQISYKYTGLPEVWTKTGAGPYYTGYMWETSDLMQVGPNSEILDRDSYAFGGIRLFAEDPDTVNKSKPVSPQTQFTLLDRFSVSTMITIRKVLVLGEVKYEVRSKVDDLVGYGDMMIDRFHLGFDFDLFELERVYTYSTMTWSEYITDVFEYIGLFTGVCIFTLIVAPANRAKVD